MHGICLPIPFWKMSGAGNDFLVIDHRKPLIPKELMAEFGVSPVSTVMIGDTSHDLLMARNAGVDSLAVTYGAHPHDHLAEHGPRACLHDVAELAAWLKTNA